MRTLKKEHIALILFIASELCYYLLIAQTGIVESFNSNIFAIVPLPIGGIIGSVICFKWQLESENKIKFFLLLQLFVTLFYPYLSNILLFVLGISVGALAPLLIHELKKATYFHLGVALALSYAVGTFLFTSNPLERMPLAMILTSIALVCTFFLPQKMVKKEYAQHFPLIIMSLWIFLDSALFETLSRDVSISIWRDGFTVEIILFHLVGVMAGFYMRYEKEQQGLFILLLFALSYLFYFINEPLLLSIVYPFVISYYNVCILQTIMHKSLKQIAVFMVFIGWIASGGGLFIALEHSIIFVPIIFIVILFIMMNAQKKSIKEYAYV